MNNVFKAPKEKSASAHEFTPKGMRFFSTFCVHPDGITVENQEPDEHVELFLRRDFATNIPWIITSILFALFPLALPLLFSAPLALPFLSPLFITYLLLFYYTLVIGYALVNFISWFYNISIVTTTRVIDIDYLNLSYKNVAATTTDNIEDISYTQSGFFPTFYDFGDVFVQTKGEIANFDLNQVPRPAKVVDLVIDLIEGRFTHD